MKKTLTILIVLFGIKGVMAQRLTDMTNYPATPQTSALFKAIAAPVSYYTGQPDVSIPLYTISQDGVTVPITISFNTSGIFVNEEATSLGLGVRLDWGGSIVRNPNGSPDERGFFTDPYLIGNMKLDLPKNYSNTESLLCFPYCISGPSLENLKDRIRLYHNANVYNDPFKPGPVPQSSDFRPDDFYYNVLGKSGLFKFNQADRKFVTFPLDDIKIENTSAPYTLQKFEITTSDGVKATLGDGAIESAEITSNGYTQSLFIKKITTVKNSTIDFSYMENQYWKYSASNIEVRIPDPPGGYYAGGVLNGYLYHEKLIKSISFKEGKLDFIYVNDRTDISATDVYSNLPNSGQPAPRLSKIILSNSSNQPIKTFQFYQSYFMASSSLSVEDKNRLRLDSFSIQDNASNSIEEYKFEYNTSASLPSKTSSARDHWGYYNGANNNIGLIPSTLMPLNYGQFGTSWSGYDNLNDYFIQTLKSNRFINSAANKVFTLKKIKFPTGGEREYVFEDNEVPWYELFAQMKDISNDGYDMINQRFMVQGQTLLDSYPAPVVNSTNAERTMTVYADEFTVQDFNDPVLGLPSLFVRTNFINPSVTLSQLNMWPYKIEISLEKKSGSVFSFYTTLVNINRTDSNVTYNPTILRKLSNLSDGIYRISVKMTTPPPYIMNNWVSQSGQAMTFGHNTVIGLAYRKKNFSNIRVGGLRIKEITDRDGTNEYKTTYEYAAAGNYCSGHLVNIPEYKEKIVTVTPRSTPNNVGNYYDDYYGYRIWSESVMPITKTQGSNVGYTNVTKKTIGGTEVIKEEFVFKYTPSIQSGYMKEYYQELEPRAWQSGKLISDKKYNGSTLVSEDILDYYGLSNEADKGSVEGIDTSLLTGSIYNLAGFSDMYDISIDRRLGPIIYAGVSLYPSLYYFDNRSDYAFGNANNFAVVNVSPPSKIPYSKTYSGFDKLKSKTTTNYFGSNAVTQTENYYYDALPTNLGLSRQETTGSQNETITTKFYYPQDLITEPLMSNMVSANRIGAPIRTEQLRNGVKMNEEKFTYAQDATTANLLLPKNVYSAKFPNALPVITNVGQLEKKITYDKYDDNGTLLQYTPEDGVPTAIIWGYNKMLPIAKIENATYSQVLAYVANLQSLSNTGTEANLIIALDNLRSVSGLSGAMITTYTYKTLIGVTTITDPKGDRLTYTYDAYGRLQNVKDKSDNILSENQYNYRP